MSRRQVVKLGVQGAVAGMAARAIEAARAADTIDRQALAGRHNIVRTANNANSPLQVGNGTIAFGADITGLQTFTRFNVLSHWGWHPFPPAPGQNPADFLGQKIDMHGRPIVISAPNPDQHPLSDWLYSNPHRLPLGNIGLRLTHADGSGAALADLTATRQELDLWTGVLRSEFTFDGAPVTVETCSHPDMDAFAFYIDSPLIAAGRLALQISFPYDDGREFNTLLGDYAQPGKHQTVVTRNTDRRADLARTLDATHYNASVGWRGEGAFTPTDTPHHFLLQPVGAGPLEAIVLFTPDNPPRRLPRARAAFDASRRHWPGYWKSGGAIDLSASMDPRWKELERRIVLSQYLMAVNEAGAWPPQESGLVNNGWNGKFHLEMYWWHAAHWALWDRWPQLSRSIDFYQRFLPSAKVRAQSQGFEGARWPKCTTPDGQESPHIIHGLLIWQQPHPLFFAELDYRAHPNRKTLEKWRDVVFDTADFLTSYAFWDATASQYVLGPPVVPVSENTDFMKTENPTFELAYWRFGLRIAQTWRERLGMERSAEWDKVARGLAPLPVQEGSYVLYQGVQDMWTRWNFEHPALTGVYGWLPGDGVDVPTMHATLENVMQQWRFDHVWGWDFPMLAMCAARLGEPERAIDLLLHPSPNFQFDDAGLATGGPFPYFPSNGGLLYAVALMTAGWDGAPARNAPGFPDRGKWSVRSEGLKTAI